MIRRRLGIGPRSGGHRGEVGFTLIELLVVIALLTIVVGLLMYPLLGGFTFLSKGKARHEANAAARFAMDVMTRELSNAIDVILVQEQEIVFVLPNMRTYCPAGGGHWVQQGGRDYYSYYCPEHQTANVQHELVEPLAPMRDAAGQRLAIVYHRGSGGQAAGGYLARSVVPFPPADQLQNWAAWRAQLSRVTPGALTPTGEDFGIARIRFAPTTIANEVLTPYWRGRDSDYSIYRARYPLWRPRATLYSVEVRDPAGEVVPNPYNVDARSGTVSFALPLEEPVAATAGYDPERPLAPPILGRYGPIVRGTEVITGPNGSAFVRAGVISQEHPPVLGSAPAEGEYWIDYQTGSIYVNPMYASGNNPPVFRVSYMRHQINEDYSVIASYQTYALLNIDLTVQKWERESGRAGPEGILGPYQDFEISGKVKLLNVGQ